MKTWQIDYETKEGKRRFVDVRADDIMFAVASVEGNPELSVKMIYSAEHRKPRKGWDLETPKRRKVVPRVLERKFPLGISKKEADSQRNDLAGCDWLPVLLQGRSPREIGWFLHRALEDPYLVFATRTGCTDKEEWVRYVDECWMVFRVSPARATLKEFYQKQSPKLRKHLWEFYRVTLYDEMIRTSLYEHVAGLYHPFLEEAGIL